MIKQPEKTELYDGLHGGTGNIWVTRNVTKEDQLEGLDMFAKVEVDIGASIGYHEHIHDAEVYYITAGKGIFFDNGKVEKSVQPGDFCFISKGQGHGIQNTGDSILEIIAVVVP